LVRTAVLDEFGEIAQQRRYAIPLHSNVVELAQHYPLLLRTVVILFAGSFVELGVTAQLRVRMVETTSIIEIVVGWSRLHFDLLLQPTEVTEVLSFEACALLQQLEDVKRHQL